MVAKTFRERELGCKGLHCFNLDSVIEGLECRRLDEHFVESQQQGDLIPPLACSFSKANPHILALADEDGGLIIYNTNKNGLHAVQQDWLAHTNAVFDLDWMPGDNHLLTASGDQSIILWDVTSEEKLATFKGHNSSVKTVRFRDGDNSVFASGSRDGHVMVWDKRIKQKEGHIGSVNVVRNAHACNPTTPAGRRRRSMGAPDSQQSVTAVIFQDDYTLISTGSVDGSVKVWDMRKNYSTFKMEAVAKHIFAYPGVSIRSHGYSSLVMDSARSQLFASCMDNIIYQFDCATFSSQPEACFRGHQNSTFYVRTCISPDDQYLMSGSSDNNALIWRIDNPLASPLALKGHCSEVSAVAWCSTDIAKCATSSDDGTLRIWRSVRRDGKPDIGEVVGSTERTHREIGVTANTPLQSMTSPRMGTPQQIRNILTSPIKGTTLPHSPAKVSSVVRSSLVAMASSNNKFSPGFSPGFPGRPSPKLVSPSITRWFRKPGSPAMSPRKTPPMSPRKLVLTPKKLPGTPVRLNTPEQGVKRKFEASAENGNSDVTPGKRLCKQESTDQTTSKNTPRKTPGTDGPKPTRVLTPRACNNHKLDVSDVTSAKKSLFGRGDFKATPTKLRQSPRLYQSPTMNLPNYVLNPEPRAPVGKKSDEDADKMPDWLTKIRLEKQDSEKKLKDLKDSKPEEESPVVENSPAVGIRGRRIAKAARGSARTPRRRASTQQNAEMVTPTRGRGSGKSSSKTPGSKAATPRQKRTVTLPSTPVSTRSPSTPASAMRRRGSILEYFSPRAEQK